MFPLQHVPYPLYKIMANSKICTVSSCTKKRNYKLYCSAHYHRWKKWGDPEGGTARTGAPLRFTLDAAKTKTNECIIWPYATSSNGYGNLIIDGKNCKPHIEVCKITHGEKPSSAHEAAHACRNPSCVNPKHLRWATPKENAKDKIKHGTVTKGRKAVGAAKISEAQAIQIIKLLDQKTNYELADLFGCSYGIVRGIRSGEKWKWLQHYKSSSSPVKGSKP